MFVGSMVASIGAHIEYGFMRIFYEHTMLMADLSTSKHSSGDVRVSPHIKAKADEDIEKTFELYGNSILRLAYSYLHNMEDAEEILQETLIRYMDKGMEFENNSHKKAWLLRVAANLSKNKIDYNNIRKTDELNEELVAEDKRDLSFIWEAVKSLSASQREVIHLFYHEDYTAVQIAEVLNEKESTVRSHLKRGRDKLKAILKEEYDFD